MAWIESHQELGAHPKTRKLAQLLGVHRMQVVGHLHALWWWALDYAEDGDLSRFDVADIALGAEWDGDPDKFVQALVECGTRGGAGFLDAVDEGWFIHDWNQHTAPLRAVRNSSRRANHERWHVRRGMRSDDCEFCAESESHPPDIRPESAGDAEDVRPESTKPNQTEPNPSSARRPNGTRLPDGFVVTSDMRSWVNDHCPGLDWREHTTRFCDYWRGVAGAKGRKADWPATWRNWMRRAYDDNPAVAQKVVER